MATLDNSDVIRNFFRAFNEKNADLLRSTMHPDAIMESIPLGTTEKLIDHCMSYQRAMSDARVEITQLVAHGDHVVVEFIGRGTHDGPFPGPGGSLIPPTNRQLEVRFAEVFRLRDGRIAVLRMYFDALTLLNQMGLGAQPVSGVRPEAARPEARH